LASDSSQGRFSEKRLDVHMKATANSGNSRKDCNGRNSNLELSETESGSAEWRLSANATPCGRYDSRDPGNIAVGPIYLDLPDTLSLRQTEVPWGSHLLKAGLSALTTIAILHSRETQFRGPSLIYEAVIHAPRFRVFIRLVPMVIWITVPNWATMWANMSLGGSPNICWSSLFS
jgi:hypothetical protein